MPEAKIVKNRLHLDLYPGGRDRSRPMEERRASVDEAVARLLEAGAGVVRRSTDVASNVVGSYFVVMQDPEGNEFCVS